MFKTENEIFFTVVLGAFLFITLSIIIVFAITSLKRRQQKHYAEIEKMQIEFRTQLLQSKIETQEETLSALGKELHDNIGQLLNSTKLLIGVSQRKLTNIPDTLNIADQTLGTAINELRSLSKSLNKEWLQQFNFIENLETEIKRINAADSLQIYFTYPASLPLKSDEQIILFRIVQEAMQNAMKHASASEIHVSIEEVSTVLTINIRDNGTGISDAKKSANGVGLLNMQHRTQLLGGTIEWKSSHKGTAAIINLPVKTTDA